MRIYNTLPGKKEKFVPQEAGIVKMYVCGITPYDKSHLGHARTFVSFDFIRRYLLFKGFKVTFVQNITDIDDKIIKRAKQRKVLPLELSKKYSKMYEKEEKELGIMKPDFAPKVSENIPKIIELIKRIEKNGFCYTTKSGVYFDVLKFKEYGKLSHQSTEKIRAGARVEVDETKKNPHDFALWKLEEEPGATFDSPWGKGRPGWHIECSAMSTSILGDTLDIHGGARDLIFPHHENEICQSEAGTGKPFVKYWLHTGFLTVNKEKMAKSLGNFITIEEGLKKYKSQQIRMFFALSHYRSPIDFSEDAICAAGNSLNTLHSAIKAARTYPLPAKGSGNLQKEAINAEKEFVAAMDDDFDSPNAFAALFLLAKRISGECSDGTAGKNEALIAAEKLEKLLSVFGLGPKEKEKKGINKKKIEEMLRKRDEAREKKDYAASDKIRDELEKQGIVVEDRKDGKTVWRNK